MGVWFRKYWFLCALVAVPVITIADTSLWSVRVGQWLKDHHGPDLIIVSIFFLSGLILETDQIRKGLADIPATIAALGVIFILAPLVALGLSLIPLNIQIITGLLIVAVMPTTLSSGVVMTGAAGGNVAHALFVTILANALAVITIPLVLGMLLSGVENGRIIEIDKFAMMQKMVLLVLTPLIAGWVVRWRIGAVRKSSVNRVQIVNSGLILAMVWMALSKGRSVLVSHIGAIVPILFLVFFFHLVLVIGAMVVARLFNLSPGRRESVIFMGGQKTLPLSIIVQVSLFPEYGLALVVCVLHHIIHLIMDGYLVVKLRR